ncbi:MAG: molybdopterin cofactor-binding domain-containing protein [Vicinamibacterales bacterium]
MQSSTLVSRRALLEAGALVVGFAASASLPELAFGQSTAGSIAPPLPPPGKPISPEQVDSFLAIHRDGTATVYTSKVDVGQGIRAAMAQIVAEEIGIRAEDVIIVEGDTAVCPDQGGTGGSTGLTRGGTEIRRAAATVHQALLSLASARLNRPVAQLIAKGGRVAPREGGTGVAIGELVGGQRLDLTPSADAPLRRPDDYSEVGRPVARRDVVAKATGTYTYIVDVRVPGMMHARVIRQPFGARLRAVDESGLAGIPAARVVRVRNFLAVVAPDEWAAVKAAAALKVTWDEGEPLPGSAGIQEWTRYGTPDRAQVVVDTGDAAKGLDAAAVRVSATYFWPYQSHASLGPSCAVADVRPDGSATVWSASQSGGALRTNLAKVFGLPLDRVRVVFVEGAGSYGTNGGDHAAADAVLISKTIGRPVRVQWMREDEHAWDPKGPQQLLDVTAGLDASGRIVGWKTDMWLSANAPGARAFLAADAAGLAQEHGSGAGAITQNGDPSYDADNVRVEAHWIKEAPLQLSNLRAPGKIANVFAVESVIDELAMAAAVDPVAFRLARLSDPRAIEVVRRAADAFGWRPRVGPNPNGRDGGVLVGRGFSYMRYKQNENYVALAMEVTVDPRTGIVRPRRVACAHDGGLVVNPDGLRNQIEGSIVQTLSRALHEEVTFDDRAVTSVDWASYPILRFPEAPRVDVVLVNRPNEPLMGAGEAATAPVAAALANAMFDATGMRFRTVPFTPARVRTILGQST